MDWEDLFDEDVVNRGYSYLMERRVKKFQIYNNYIIAQVLGTHKYAVEVHINPNRIVDMECSCYYGERCEHIAAVMHYFDEHYNGMIMNMSTLSTYKRKVDQCCSSKAKNNVGNIQNILYNDVGTLMENEHYSDAFELITYILEKVDDEDIIDSCIQLFEEIMIYADDYLMNKINLWMEEYAEMSYGYLSEELQRLLSEYFL